MAAHASFRSLTAPEVDSLLARRPAREACLDLLNLFKVILAPFTTVAVFPMEDYRAAEQLLDDYLDALPDDLKSKMSANRDSVLALRDAYISPREDARGALQARVDGYVEALIDQYIALQPARKAASSPNSLAAASRTEVPTFEYNSDS